MISIVSDPALKKDPFGFPQNESYIRLSAQCGARPVGKRFIGRGAPGRKTGMACASLHNPRSLIAVVQHLFSQGKTNAQRRRRTADGWKVRTTVLEIQDKDGRARKRPARGKNERQFHSR
jgi:hypothetical protein